jgi:hypothetical protein
MVSLGDLAEVGPDVRDIHDGFRVDVGPTTYPALMGHETNGTRHIAQDVTGYLAPLARAKPGRPLRRGGLSLSTAELPTRDVSANRSWHCGLNSTLGLIVLMAARVDTEGPWIKVKKPIISGLRVLDPSRLSPQQRARLVQLYAQVRTLDLRRIPEIAEDAVRAQIDAGLMDVLSLDTNLMTVRELVAYEPLLRPGAAAPVVEEPPATESTEQLPLIPVTAGRRPLTRVAERRSPYRVRGVVGRRR